MIEKQNQGLQAKIERMGEVDEGRMKELNELRFKAEAEIRRKTEEMNTMGNLKNMIEFNYQVP